MARIVVCGYMIRHPVAGNLLAYFHYSVGLAPPGARGRLRGGERLAGACYDPVTGDLRRRSRSRPARRAGVAGRSRCHGPGLLRRPRDRRVHGADWDDVKQMLKEADLLLNVGGVCWLPEFHLCRRRALIDMDPLFTQVGQFGAWLLDDHHVHFSYGANIGRPECTVPTQGIDWLPTVPPVVPEIWQVREPGRAAEANGGASVTLHHRSQLECLRRRDIPGRALRPEGRGVPSPARPSQPDQGTAGTGPVGSQLGGDGPAARRRVVGPQRRRGERRHADVPSLHRGLARGVQRGQARIRQDPERVVQ